MHIKDVELTKGKVKVVFTYIGEGVCGDYNENDPNDKPLLRFYVLKKEGKDWYAVDDASYCTNFLATAPLEQKKKGLEIIMKAVYDKVVTGKSIKKICEQLSYIDENMNVPSFEKVQ